MTAVRTSPAREQLLRTASQLFYAEGIRAVGVDRVISEAGITRATFYRHFPSKEDLAVAYLEGVDRAVRHHAEGLALDHPSAADWVRQFTADTADGLCGTTFRGCPFINAAAEYPDPMSAVRRVISRHRAWLAGALAEAFWHAAHLDPDDAARRWVALRDGAMVEGYLGNPVHAYTTLQSGVLDLLTACRLLGTEPAQPWASLSPTESGEG